MHKRLWISGCVLIWMCLLAGISITKYKGLELSCYTCDSTGTLKSVFTNDETIYLGFTLKNLTTKAIPYRKMTQNYYFDVDWRIEHNYPHNYDENFVPTHQHYRQFMHPEINYEYVTAMLNPGDSLVYFEHYPYMKRLTVGSWVATMYFELNIGKPYTSMFDTSNTLVFFHVVDALPKKGD